MTEYRALVDLVVAGKGVKAGATFDTSDEQAAPAVAFGLAEVVEDKPQPRNDRYEVAKPQAKRSSSRKA
jgi:hypothetical protein